MSVTWHAPPDDITALAMHLGLLNGTRTYVFQDGALVPGESDAQDSEVLAAAPQLSAYLLEQVKVTTPEGACAGALAAVGELAEDGARLDFACPTAAASATVQLALLTDIHEAYQTLATGPDVQRHLYTLEADTYDWRLDGSGESAGASAAGQLSAAVALVALAGLGGWFVLRRRRLRHVGGTTSAVP
ncbi:hypothetical protein [Nocardioides sp. W7]|uniref:hypothetical protein n=1 Tax=Nocardioides sp. W7 TaxID=2931390 RepID=UPI001FD01589|nr:hypothetical protein [Nocardioides sp. W7]